MNGLWLSWSGLCRGLGNKRVVERVFKIVMRMIMW